MELALHSLFSKQCHKMEIHFPKEHRWLNFVVVDGFSSCALVRLVLLSPRGVWARHAVPHLSYNKHSPLGSELSAPSPSPREAVTTPNQIQWV